MGERGGGGRGVLPSMITYVSRQLTTHLFGHGPCLPRARSWIGKSDSIPLVLLWTIYHASSIFGAMCNAMVNERCSWIFAAAANTAPSSRASNAARQGMAGTRPPASRPTPLASMSHRPDVTGWDPDGFD
eukprot:6214518-Pleurochrysis_carterae.AAC.2